MPTFDLYLPPKADSTWRSSQPVHSFAAAFVLIARWVDRARQRSALAALNDHSLRDIGITQVEAAREAEKPFWK